MIISSRACKAGTGISDIRRISLILFSVKELDFPVYELINRQISCPILDKHIQKTAPIYLRPRQLIINN